MKSIDEELHHAINAGLCCQFKPQNTEGAPGSSLCRKQVQLEDPESRPLAPLNSPQSVSPGGDQTFCPVTYLECTDSRPGSNEMAWRENKESTGIKKEKRGGKGVQRLGLGMGGEGKFLHYKGGEEVMEAKGKQKG